MPASPPDVIIEHPKQQPLQEVPSVTMQDLWNAIQSFQDQVLVRLDRMESRLGTLENTLNKSNQQI